MRVAYLGPPGTLHRGCAARRRSATDGAEPSRRDGPRRDPRRRARATRSARWSRSRTRSRARCARRSTRSPSTPSRVAIVGEHDHPIRHSLIARARAAARARSRRCSPTPRRAPSALASSASSCPPPRSAPAPSTADAVRQVADSRASRGRRSARARRRSIYGCEVLAEGVEDGPDNVTRFVWIAPPRHRRPRATGGVADDAGLLRARRGPARGAGRGAARVLATAGVNLTRIESRPRRRGLGRYMFFIDLDGSAEDPIVAEAIEGLRAQGRVGAGPRQLSGEHDRECPAGPATPG